MPNHRQAGKVLKITQELMQVFKSQNNRKSYRLPAGHRSSKSNTIVFVVIWLPSSILECNIIYHGSRLNQSANRSLYLASITVQNGTQLACNPDTRPLTLHLKEALIESLHYPHRYSSIDCQWHIDVSEEHALYVSRSQDEWCRWTTRCSVNS